MENEQYLGIVEDPRSELEKSFDFQHEELAGANIPNWKEKTEFKKYPMKNQDGSLSCVGQATAKMLGILQKEYTNLSPKFIYTRRANYPNGGMWLPNALNIAVKEGSCLEETLPSDFKPESFMNDKTQETPECAIEAKKYKGKAFFEIKNISMNALAEVLEQGYPLLLGFRFDYDEWTEIPTVNPNSKNSCGHGVTGTDYGILLGKKVISIDDSWGPYTGKGGQRFITEEFLKAKCFFAGYIMPVTKQEEETEFHYKWEKYMVFNGINNRDDVKAMQTALRILGLFPLEARIDGLYGPITRKAVSDFQKKYLPSNNKGIQAGPKTIAKLNEMFV